MKKTKMKKLQNKKKRKKIKVPKVTNPVPGVIVLRSIREIHWGLRLKYALFTRNVSVLMVLVDKTGLMGKSANSPTQGNVSSFVGMARERVAA